MAKFSTTWAWVIVPELLNVFVLHAKDGAAGIAHEEYIFACLVLHCDHVDRRISATHFGNGTTS